VAIARGFLMHCGVYVGNKTREATMADMVFLTDVRGNLARLNVQTGAFQIIGNSGIAFTDIAFAPSGALYGVTADALYTVDSVTARATLLNNTSILVWNSLDIDVNGVGYTASALPFLYQVDLTTGIFTQISSASSQLLVTVILHFTRGDLLLANRFGQIVDVDPSSGAVQGAVTHGVRELYGLVSLGEDRLYGFSQNNRYQIDNETGQATFLYSYGLSSFGPVFGAAYYGNFQTRLDVDFSALEYIASYPDLISAFGAHPNLVQWPRQMTREGWFHGGGTAQDAEVVVTVGDQGLLEAIVVDRDRAQKHVQRARIVPLSAGRPSVAEVAREVGASRPSAWRWQRRFAEEGVEGLLRDKTRPPGTAPLP
jgi:Homeodomain-like domain